MSILRKVFHQLTNHESLKIHRVEKRGGSYCVIHAHPKKKGSKTDKPEGTAIHCYSIEKYGDKEAKRKADAMHFAIVSSQHQNVFNAAKKPGPGDTDLHTVIVKKTKGMTLEEAKKEALKHVKSVPTNRETSTSWRFRQRNPEDFVQTSFWTKPLNDKVSLVFGKLK